MMSALGTGRKLKIAFYSHDTLGLGHIRRNLLIANTLSRNGICSAILMIAGASKVASFKMPPSSLSEKSIRPTKTRKFDLAVCRRRQDSAKASQ